MRAVTTRLLLLLSVALAACSKREAPRPPRDAGVAWRRIDVHQHVSSGAISRARRLNELHGIDLAVNLSGGWPGMGLERAQAEAQQANGHVVVFATPPLGFAAHGEEGVQELVRGLRQAKQLGAKGVKIFKQLGLSTEGPGGRLLTVDDPLLDPFFDACGELGLPVAIHTGDPVAFWNEVGPENERVDELTVHPGWSYFGKDVPTWEALFSAYERRVARHPKTTFIGVHFGNAPEFPERVAAMLEQYPNLYVDTAARVPELGHRDAAKLRALFVRWQDRILFGTDLGVGALELDLMLGSTGATPPGPDDVERFFDGTYRFFETEQRQIPTPTPIQGRWNVDGLGLPREVLEKLYVTNAKRLLGV